MLLLLKYFVSVAQIMSWHVARRRDILEVQNPEGSARNK
jgi:hypothetical protein